MENKHTQQVDFSNPNVDKIKSNSTTSYQLELSDKVLFEQATVAMEEMYGYGCETEIDAYFRGLKWMQKQFNKQD
jgi:hypothetical protein